MEIEHEEIKNLSIRLQLKLNQELQKTKQLTHDDVLNRMTTQKKQLDSAISSYCVWPSMIQSKISSSCGLPPQLLTNVLKYQGTLDLLKEMQSQLERSICSLKKETKHSEIVQNHLSAAYTTIISKLQNAYEPAG